MSDPVRDSGWLEPVGSSDEHGFFIELAGHRLRREEASELAAKLHEAIHDDRYTRGVAAGRPAATARARFSPGLDAARLDRFLRATSDEPAKPSPAIISPPPHERLSDVTAATPPMRLADEERAREPPVKVPAAAFSAPRTPRDPVAAQFVHQRAAEWWSRASDNDLPLGVRGEARVIAAELFQVAEELRRGERAPTEDGSAGEP